MIKAIANTKISEAYSLGKLVYSYFVKKTHNLTFRYYGRWMSISEERVL